MILIFNTNIKFDGPKYFLAFTPEPVNSSPRDYEIACDSGLAFLFNLRQWPAVSQQPLLHNSMGYYCTICCFG